MKQKTRKRGVNRGEHRFELADLTPLDPERVLSRQGEDRFQTFMLTLGLVHNDLKGLEFFAQCWRGYKKPEEFEITPHAGEHRGLDMQLHRLTVGLIRELLKFIHDFQDVLASPKFTDLAKRSSLRYELRWAWEDLVKVALGEGNPRDNDFWKVLERIRHGIAFHYYQPDALVQGYRYHFFELPPNPANEHAYISVGKDMQSTRWFHVDAGVSGALLVAQGRMGDPMAFPKRVVRVKRTINQVLASFLSHYLASAKRKPGPTGAHKRRK